MTTGGSALRSGLRSTHHSKKRTEAGPSPRASALTTERRSLRTMTKASNNTRRNFLKLSTGALVAGAGVATVPAVSESAWFRRG